MESLIQESVYRKKVEVMSHNQDFLQNDFELVFQDEKIQTDVVYQGQSFWKDVWHRFIQNKGALVGFVFIVFFSVNGYFCTDV